MRVVLGMDFGGTKIAVAVCDLDGRCLAQQTLATCAEHGGRAVLQRGISGGQALLNGLVGSHSLAAVGLSTIGVPRDDGTELAPAIAGWEQVALARSIQEAFGVPVGVANDVKAAATAEVRWGALAGWDPAIYLNLGTGLAAAIVIGGRVLSGAHGASGEIGYNLMARRDVGLALGQRAMLEDTVSGMSLAAHGSAHVGRPVTAEQVFHGAPDDPDLDAITSTLIGDLSLHLVNLTIAIDPVRIAVGGGMVKSWARLRGPWKRRSNQGCRSPPTLSWRPTPSTLRSSVRWP